VSDCEELVVPSEGASR